MCGQFIQDVYKDAKRISMNEFVFIWLTAHCGFTQVSCFNI